MINKNPNKDTSKNPNKKTNSEAKELLKAKLEQGSQPLLTWEKGKGLIDKNKESKKG